MTKSIADYSEEERAQARKEICAMEPGPEKTQTIIGYCRQVDANRRERLEQE